MNASPVERVQIHARQQRALREDAREQLELSASARSSAELTLAEAERVHAMATAASRSDRTNGQAADAVVRAGVTVEHARADVAEAIARHAEATETLATAERNVDEAQRAADRAELEAELSSPATSEGFVALGARVARAVIELRQTVMALQEALDKDAALVAKARSLGSTIAPRDATSAGAGLLAEILANGGWLAQDPVQARWALEEGRSNRAVAIVSLVGPALDVERTAPTYVRAALERTVALWRSARNASEVRVAEETRAKAEREQSRRAGEISNAEAFARRTAAEGASKRKPWPPYKPTPARPAPKLGTFRPSEEESDPPDGAYSASGGAWRGRAAE